MPSVITYARSSPRRDGLRRVGGIYGARLGEEIRYPHITLPRALKIAPWIIFAVNAIFEWALVGIAPAGSLPQIAAAAAPYAEAMRLSGIVGFSLIVLCLGIAFGGDFSTLNACLTAPSRGLPVGAPVTVALFAVMMCARDKTAILLGAAWTALGFLAWLCAKKAPDTLPLLPVTVYPALYERKKMDREYRRWKAFALASFAFAAVCYCISVLV